MHIVIVGTSVGSERLDYLEVEDVPILEIALLSVVETLAVQALEHEEVWVSLRQTDIICYVPLPDLEG